MPHIVIQASPSIGSRIDWAYALTALHTKLADGGFASLTALKSRVQSLAHTLAGNDVGAEQLVVNLIMTQPRPVEKQEAMARVIHEHLSAAVAETQPEHWVQCCVFFQTVPAGTYLHKMWNGPAA